MDRVLTHWDWDTLPQSDDDIWDSLLSTVFLGATVRTAQAIYMKEVLGSMIELNVAKAVATDPVWSQKVIKVINSELASISGTPGEGLKRAILHSVTNDAQSLDLSRTINTAFNFITKNKLSVKKIEQIQDNFKETLNLVDLAAREIYNVRYVKAVLWFYGCGIAENIVPPNGHVIRFLRECGYSGFGSQRDPPDDWQIFTPACACMKNVSQEVETALGKKISPKQAQTAVWYLQTCKGLLPRNYKSKLNPFLLMDFLDLQRWDIPELDQKIASIEELESLAFDLKSFIDSL